MNMGPEHLTFFLFYNEIGKQPPATHMNWSCETVVFQWALFQVTPHGLRRHMSIATWWLSHSLNILSYIKLHRVPKGPKKKHWNHPSGLTYIYRCIYLYRCERRWHHYIVTLTKTNIDPELSGHPKRKLHRLQHLPTIIFHPPSQRRFRSSQHSSRPAWYAPGIFNDNMDGR